MPIFGKPDVHKLKCNNDVKGLGKALSNKDNVTRWEAAKALGLNGGQEAIDYLLNALIKSEPCPQVRQMIAESLGYIGDLRSIDTLIRLTEDPKWSVRDAAVVALGDLGDEKGIEPILNLLNKFSIYYSETKDGPHYFTFYTPRSTYDLLLDSLRYVTDALGKIAGREGRIKNPKALEALRSMANIYSGKDYNLTNILSGNMQDYFRERLSSQAGASIRDTESSGNPPHSPGDGSFLRGPDPKDFETYDYSSDSNLIDDPKVLANLEKAQKEKEHA
jgi:hypothetical protein